MNDIRRAIAYAASRLCIGTASAELLPGRVLSDLWDQRALEQRAVELADEEQEDQDGPHDPDPTG